jgi:photosystem II stability/assembly factor-like uncharacterized protein
MLRQQEHEVARLEGNEDIKLTTVGEGMKMAMTLEATKLVRGGKPKKPAKKSIRKELAQQRLDALEQARTLPHLDPGAPVVATEAGGGPAPVAPVAGISNWVQLGPTAIPKGQTYSSARVNVTGRITAILVDPTNSNIIYAGAAQGGVWKTTDGGANWVAMSDNEVSLAIGALAMDPSDHLTLYAGTGEANFSLDSYYGAGILKTINGGSSWTNLNPGGIFTGRRFARIAISPGIPSRLFAATNNGVYRSIDSGANWTLMSSGLPAAPATDLVIDPTTPTTAYAAFWQQGIYKTTNAAAATPTWTQLTSGLPSATSAAPNGFTRIALDISPSSPTTLYALFANNDTTSPAPGPPYRYAIDKLYVSNDSGNTWSSITLSGGPGTGIGGQGFYNINVAVDPTTPNIVYLSGISLWKATRSTMTGAWTITDIGRPFHPDNHALCFDPTNHLTIYAGSDGGIYKSTDGGATWSDTINEGPCITQFEFIAQHPTSDAVVFGGTQDNGTEQFRNSTVFHHADDGDGGFVAIDASQPRNVISTYYSITPKRSTQGGKFGTWLPVWGGLGGSSLFYPPLDLDQSNQNNIAFGTDRVYLDASQGTGGWPSSITLPSLGSDLVSAVNYVNSNLIYVGTNRGKVYRLDKSGTTWSARALHASPLPVRYIWDVAVVPGGVDTIVVVMAGFGTAHIWQGAVPLSGTATWTDISGTGTGRLPDIPINALAIEPGSASTMYVGTDIGVFSTTNGGSSWTQFSQGLPNCAVYDLKLHNPARLLRAATHGRGLWERRLDVMAMPDINIFFRDHLMDSGRSSPAPSPVIAAFEDPLHYVALGDNLHWYMCADIKVDALEGSPPAYQMDVTAVDYVAFESKLQHRNPQRGNVNRVYVQLHNRGIQPAANVTVKLLFANASGGLPPLPADFWTVFPGNSTMISAWTPIGSPQVIPSLSPTEPTILEWDWNTPMSAADHTCLLAIVDCPADPIPATNKVLNVNTLVPNERHVGLKNLHVVNIPPATIYWTPMQFYGNIELRQVIRFLPSVARGWRTGLLFQTDPQQELQLEGITRTKLTKTMLNTLKEKVGDTVKKYDTNVLYMLENSLKGGVVSNVALAKGQDGGELQTMLLFISPIIRRGVGTLSILQEEEPRSILGGSTFVLQTLKRPQI